MLFRPVVTTRAFARSLTLLLLAAGAAAGAGCASSMVSAGGGAAAAEGGGHALGEPMPDLVVDHFWNRKEIRLSDLRGKVVLLDIWASWCVPCKDEMPVLDELARRYQGKGVEVVAVSVDEDRGAAEQFLKRKKRWALTLGHDPNGAVPNRLQPPKMPTSYLIDRQGILREVNAGFERGDGAKLEAQLRGLTEGG
jgi:cytochrome c biogenesis protein CcmG, thiol:disulfide interchange protein DsbE